jgi:penicillin-binding protein 1A
MNTWIRIPLQFLTAGLLLVLVLTAVVTGGYFYVEPTLPAAAELQDVRLQVQLSVVSSDGKLMQRYGEDKRTPLEYDEFPERLIQAFLAAEDSRFFEHSGIDYLGILRGAFYAVTRPGERVPGASTITQQVSRTANLMSRERSLVRKFREAILAFQIEREFTKEEILTLFLNTTFLGQRTNGVAAASRTYFNKDVDQLTLGEIAILAGIPQRPSEINPYNGPDGARSRRVYVLGRMFELGYITRAEREAAQAEPVISQRFDADIELSADYVAALAYEFCRWKLGKLSCDTDGLTIVTTIDSRLQEVANRSLTNLLESYDRTHGYRGPLARVDLDAVFDNAESIEQSANEALEELLSAYPSLKNADPAVVIEINEAFANVYLKNRGLVSIPLDAVSWARRWLSDDSRGPFPKAVGEVLAAGDVVRFRQQDDGSLRLYQEPAVQGALVSVDPSSGAVIAMVGGYDFQSQNFNRVTQAERQPGSSFKPFFYLSALANGYTLASIVNDAPVRFCDANLETCTSVQNYDGRAHGEVSVRYALTNSLNMAADRIVRDILPRNAIPILRRFGFGPRTLPQDTSLALGSGVVTPLQLAGAYSILANGGYATGIANPDTGDVLPYFIQRLENAAGEVLYDASLSAAKVCPEPAAAQAATAGVRTDRLILQKSDLFARQRCAVRVQEPQLIYLITDVMKDVIKNGSGRRTQQDPVLSRRTDLAGKTGTTTGPRDAWFAGFNADVVTVVRAGFDDDTRDLGAGEQGSSTALPAWIEFMSAALEGKPDRSQPRPPGIEDRLVNPENGLLAADCNRDAARWELFDSDNIPPREPDTVCFSGNPALTLPNQPSGSDGPIF